MSKVRFMSIIVLLLVVLVQVTIALADTFTSSLQHAINLYTKGKYQEASDSMNKARMELQNKAPFSIKNIHLITEEAKGYGGYTPRTTSVYKGGETVHLYVEPFGFTIVKKDEFYEVNLTVDVVIWGRHSMNPETPARRLFQDFRPAWKRLKKKLEEEGKLTGFRFHDLRRSYVTYRLAAGIDPKTVQDEVGHLDSRMTMDCYGVALRDPEVRAWAREHFSFDFNPTFSPTSPATVPSPSVTS